MNEKMQSEELEEVVSKTEIEASIPDMTFSDNTDSPQSPSFKPKLSIDDSKFCIQNQTINLEDDIEKVEVSSPESSESTEEMLRESQTKRQFFPGIPDQNPNESIKSWLHRITELQKKLNFENTSSLNQPLNNNDFALKNTSTNNPTQNPSRIVKYQDLPYMGEMTLDNSKPRRGRKPKKADICHLIYKNYGTIFPGTPNPKSYTENNSKKIDVKEMNHENVNRSDVQNRIISSLLERRLTQEIKKTKGNLHLDQKLNTKLSDQNEPLNLCIRDLNHLKIRLLKKTDNTYTSEIKSEPQSDDDVEFINEIPSPAISHKSDQKLSPTTPDSLSTPSPDISKTPDNCSSAPGGYVYWPNAGVFIHPMALQQHLMYYQRMAANGNYTLPNHSPRPPPQESSQELRKLVPKIRRNSKEETDTNQSEQKTKRNASSSTDKTPTKRKRSAIFIPPIPTENNTNPATEVSICKFKFTGGAKPSLQEKKMLSVDSGGNFRYYSGTGDKSMRGYEFFPRETLQQQINNTQGSSTGAFLQASGEKIYPVSPIDFTGNKANTDFLLTPEISPPPLNQMQDLNSRHKKRKSRKSLQREKLEQTFKEKGFLIQTQQLESAEGATYCKFRQLRKFTRYLFRSWKDYLPGSVREMQESEKIDNEDLGEQDDNLSRHSSDLSTNNVQSP